MRAFQYQQRMYGLVPYNISPIQQGIQFGHAVVEYGLSQTQQDSTDTELSPYNQWAHNDKTFIILNGGTTNNSRMALDNYGTLNKAKDELAQMGIQTATFYEPDLGDQLTAVVFLVDERVFDRETYPDYIDIPYDIDKDGESENTIKQWEDNNSMNRAKWEEKIGGEKNDFLRTWLKNFRLAN